MTRSALAIIATLGSALSACQPNSIEPALVWTVANARDRKNPAADFGGWSPGGLVIRDGEKLIFGGTTQVGGDGLVIHPGVADGVSAPFVVTDIWKNHPVPWLQPVWVPRTPEFAAVPDVRNVFSVDIDSSFYSPFWQLEFVLFDGLNATTPPRSAREVYGDSVVERRPAPLVYCPIVPSSTVLAQDLDGPKDPSTGVVLKQLKPTLAWVEGHDANYIDLGTERFAAGNQLPIASEGFFFVTTIGGPILPVAAVLPSNPRAHSFITRIDVRLPDTAGVYVPTNRPELRAMLGELSVSTPLPSAANDDVKARTLQVAKDRACFTTGTALSDCVWLDNEAAIRSSGMFTAEQNVQFALGVVTP